jgi:hypothetical protein
MLWLLNLESTQCVEYTTHGKTVRTMPAVLPMGLHGGEKTVLLCCVVEQIIFFVSMSQTNMSLVM